MEQAETVAYVRLLARAKTASQTGSWHDAVTLWEAVTASNPVDGHFWAQLAEAYYRSGAYSRAIETYERVIEFGAGYPAEATYQIACCHALAGERDQALDTL